MLNLCHDQSLTQLLCVNILSLVMTNFLLVSDSYPIIFDILIFNATIFAMIDLWKNDWDSFMRYVSFWFMTIVLVPLVLLFSQRY
jgi:hypothetical protein